MTDRDLGRMVGTVVAVLLGVLIVLVVGLAIVVVFGLFADAVRAVTTP